MENIKFPLGRVQGKKINKLILENLHGGATM